MECDSPSGLLTSFRPDCCWCTLQAHNGLALQQGVLFRAPLGGMKVKLADGPSMRKKTVVALAPQLAVDLWRWRTGRCTLADLGLVAV